MPELTLTQILVTTAAVLLCVFVVWFFLFSKRHPGRGIASTPVQEVVITVLGGYDPENVILVQGIPARLRFQRDEKAECSEELVIPGFNIRRTLAPFKTTTLDLQPEDLGVFAFHCGMGMMKGRIIVVMPEERGHAVILSDSEGSLPNGARSADRR